MLLSFEHLTFSLHKKGESISYIERCSKKILSIHGLVVNKDSLFDIGDKKHLSTFTFANLNLGIGISIKRNTSSFLTSHLQV